ncbi:MAG: DUF427 domain-containing protein [Cyclobacteriaceae bacterium]|nr:DUF427 domain-containing protein [Cyclobacteriaceae bacterium]MCH8517601.1 DUF427 domain-containing protein [Cyclobacteriaceae bacterium]
MKAIWKDVVVAESNDTVVVEGNHYFPRSSCRTDLFEESSTTTHCPWKGDAAYYSIKVGDQVNYDAAWYYPHPKSAAENITDRVAFWKGVTVTE